MRMVRSISPILVDRNLGRRLLALSHPALHLLFLPVQCIEYPLGILWRDLSGARLAGIAGLSFLGLFRLLLFGLLFLFLLLWICFCCIKEAKFFNILCAP